MCRNGYLRTIISGFVLEALIAAMFLCRCSGVITSDNQDVNKESYIKYLIKSDIFKRNGIPSGSSS